MQPLWVAFPDVLPMDWPRPQAWNEYSDAWKAFYFGLPDNERRTYREANQEPPEWTGFYRFISGPEWP